MDVGSEMGEVHHQPREDDLIQGKGRDLLRAGRGFLPPDAYLIRRYSYPSRTKIGAP